MGDFFTNNLDAAATTLSAGIDDATLTIPVVGADVAHIPDGAAAGGCRIRIEDELVTLVSRSGDTLTALARGVEGTVAAAHLISAPVTCFMTAGALNDWLSANLPTNGLLIANNLSDVANVNTSRANLGVGSAGTASAATFAIVTNNLSDLTNAGTARENLGLGNAATDNASTFVLATAVSGFLKTTNNLSDLTNTGTARTHLGLGNAATDNAATFVLATATGGFLATANNLSDVANPSIALGNLGALANPMTTAGDLIVGTSGGIPSRLAIGGSEGEVFVVSGGLPTWTSTLLDDSDVPSVAIADRILSDSNGNRSIDWTGRFIYDNTQVLSIDYSQRYLADSASNPSVLYNSRQLIASDGNTVILDWNAGTPGSVNDTSATTLTLLTDAITAISALRTQVQQIKAILQTYGIVLPG